MNDLVRQGRVRYVACSNYQAWRLTEALWISEVNNLERFVCYQPQYSLVVRDIEQELVPVCLRKGLGIVPWAPLASGFLAGKYQPGEREVAGGRDSDGWAWHGPFFADNADETLSVLLEVADALRKTPAQVALRWVLEQPGIASVITGVRTVRATAGITSARRVGDSRAEPLERLNEVSHSTRPLSGVIRVRIQGQTG
ncbi:MAG: aldo/keto reductase [Trueperaceae bacterium]|nr:aldo/keto reductase [Trueperaceae bacterium]